MGTGGVWGQDAFWGEQRTRVWGDEEGLGGRMGREATEAPPLSPGCIEAEPRGQRGPESPVRTQSDVSGRWVWRGPRGKDRAGWGLKPAGEPLM